MAGLSPILRENTIEHAGKIYTLIIQNGKKGKEQKVQLESEGEL